MMTFVGQIVGAQYSKYYKNHKMNQSFLKKNIRTIPILKSRPKVGFISSYSMREMN
jgi:hypothetical protein